MDLWAAGLKIIFGTYSSCGANGLNFSLVLIPVALFLKKSGILKETKNIKNSTFDTKNRLLDQYNFNVSHFRTQG